MPAEAFLAFQEGDPQCRRGCYLGVVFLDGDCQGEVGRSEPDPDHVVDTEFCQFSGPIVQTSYHGCPSSHVTASALTRRTSSEDAQAEHHVMIIG